jgi:hypothetical protein
MGLPSMTPGKTLVILQSNYIPWKGYFDLMAAADEFVIYDEVQFTKNDWRNRNRIVLNGKLHWLTISVKTAGLFGQPIDRIEISDKSWARGHWDSIRQAYRNSEHFHQISAVLADAYQEAASLRRLTDINELFLRRIADILELPAQIFRAEIVPRASEDPTERLIELCRARNATKYLSGPAARSYIRADLFANAGIALHYADYSGYPTYSQAMDPFEHGVSILDVLFHCGAASARAQLKSISSPGGLQALDYTNRS